MGHATDPTVMSGVATPGCDCGHDGMGRGWHTTFCAWLSAPIPIGVPHDFVSDDGGMFCDAALPGYGRCGFIRSAGWHTGVDEPEHHAGLEVRDELALREVERGTPAFDPSVTVGPDGRVLGYVSPPLAPMFDREHGVPERRNWETGTLVAYVLVVGLFIGVLVAAALASR